MAEGSGVQENQEIPKPQSPQIKEVPKTRQILSNDPDVVEHIDNYEVEALTRKIGEFYGLPSERIKNALASVYVMKNSGFTRRVDDNIVQKLRRKGISIKSESSEEADLLDLFENLKTGKSLEEVKKERIKQEDEMLRLKKEHIEGMGGVAFLKVDTRTVLIKERSNFPREVIEVHELIHSLGVNSESGEDGELGSGFSKPNGEYHYLNEAATELLRLGFQNPDFGIEKFWEGINSGEIAVGYKSHVKRLLTAMKIASKSKKPFTIKDLAKHYFADGGEITLQWDLLENSPQSYHKTLLEWFDGVFRGGTVVRSGQG